MSNLQKRHIGINDTLALLSPLNLSGPHLYAFRCRNHNKGPDKPKHGNTRNRNIALFLTPFLFLPPCRNYIKGVVACLHIKVIPGPVGVTMVNIRWGYMDVVGPERARGVSTRY